MRALTIIAFVVFAAFVAISIRKFGLRKSWPAYAPYWAEAVPIHNVNLWSAVTLVVALLLVAPCINVGAHQPWQWVGFLTPAALIVSALGREKLLGCIATLAFIVGAVALCILAGWWAIALASFVLLAVVAFGTQTAGICWLLWIEFAAVLALDITLII